MSATLGRAVFISRPGCSFTGNGGALWPLWPFFYQSTPILTFRDFLHIQAHISACSLLLEWSERERPRTLKLWNRLESGVQSSGKHHLQKKRCSQILWEEYFQKTLLIGGEISVQFLILFFYSGTFWEAGHLWSVVRAKPGVSLEEGHRVMGEYRDQEWESKTSPVKKGGKWGDWKPEWCSGILQVLCAKQGAGKAQARPRHGPWAQECKPRVTVTHRSNQRESGINPARRPAPPAQVDPGHGSQGACRTGSSHRGWSRCKSAPRPSARKNKTRHQLVLMMCQGLF